MEAIVADPQIDAVAQGYPVPPGSIRRGEETRHNREMIGSRFSPEIRQALRVDISATLLFTVFAGLTSPFIGLILRRELGATPLQLAVMSSAGG